MAAPIHHHGFSLSQRMLARLKAACVWWSRIAYCRGFGIQSPSAYAFVRYVVNEHYPYYAYTELAARFPRQDVRQRKLCKFYLRLANHLQPAHVTDVHDACADIRLAYFHAGCRKAQVHQVSGLGEALEVLALASGSTCLVRLPSPEHARIVYGAVAAHASGQSVLVIEGIHAHSQARRCWRMMVDSIDSGVCYDLYDCGVVMFDRTKHKQLYEINF